MSIPFIYPEIISEIRKICIEHLSGNVSADDFQRVIQRGEGTIVAIEENDIRDFLTDIEGKIELVKFTVDTEDQLAASQEIAQNVFSWLLDRERNQLDNSCNNP